MGVVRLGYRGVVGRFFARLDALTADDWAGQIAFNNPTDQQSEEYKWLGMTPAVREWIGGRQAKGFKESGITIINKLFEATLEINADELRRDKSTQLQIRIDELAGRVAEHPAKLLTNLIVTPGNAYDGFAYFGTTHVEGDSGTQKNLYDSAMGAGAFNDVVVPANPTVAEMEKAILGAAQNMMGIKDDQGEPMNANARRFLVMVPLNLWTSTVKALTLPLIVEGSASRSNLLAAMPGFGWTPVINPRLTATDTFYVFRTDAAVKPFIWQEELFETGMLDEPELFLNNRMLFGVKLLRNVGTAYWQYAAKVQLF